MRIVVPIAPPIASQTAAVPRPADAIAEPTGDGPDRDFPGGRRPGTPRPEPDEVGLRPPVEPDDLFLGALEEGVLVAMAGA